MELYKINNKRLDHISVDAFKLEKEIQDLVESNTETLFELEFVRSEFTVGKYRVDTLCYDPNSNSFVIIEYKKGNSYSVIDQGYTYLQLLLNNKSDFILALSQKKNQIFDIASVDWSQSRIIFISPSFNSYQTDSVNFRNIPFELYEIKRYSNNTIILNQHKSNSKESIESLSNIGNNKVIKEVTKEVKVYNEEDHTSKLNDVMKDRWEELKQNIEELDDIVFNSKKQYISASLNNKVIIYCNFRTKHIRIDINRGNLNSDGSQSKNFFNLEDPKIYSKEKSWEWKDGTKGNIYSIDFNKNTDMDYLMYLIKQKYKSLI